MKIYMQVYLRFETENPRYAGTFPAEFECEIYLNLNFTLFYKSLSRCYSPDCS